MNEGPAQSTASEHIGFRHPESAVRNARAHAWLWCIGGLGLIADLWTKAWAFRELDPLMTRPWINGIIEFQLSLNAGALFGMGSGKGTLFIVASVAALGFVIYLFSGTSRHQRMMHIALGLILAGALGNLYDRATHRYDRVKFAKPVEALIGHVEPTNDANMIAVRPWFDPNHVIRRSRGDLEEPVRRVGVVRDFLRIVPKIGGRALWPWVFNVADVFLVIGVGLLVIGYWRHPHGAARPTDAHPAATDR